MRDSSANCADTQITTRRTFHLRNRFVKICVNLRIKLLPLLCLVGPSTTSGQQATLLRPAAVFDGQEMHTGWVALVNGDKIAAAGPAANIPVPADARTSIYPVKR